MYSFACTISDHIHKKIYISLFVP